MWFSYGSTWNSIAKDTPLMCGAQGCWDILLADPFWHIYISGPFSGYKQIAGTLEQRSQTGDQMCFASCLTVTHLSQHWQLGGFLQLLGVLTSQEIWPPLVHVEQWLQLSDGPEMPCLPPPHHSRSFLNTWSVPFIWELCLANWGLLFFGEYWLVISYIYETFNL